MEIVHSHRPVSLPKIEVISLPPEYGAERFFGLSVQAGGREVFFWRERFSCHDTSPGDLSCTEPRSWWQQVAKTPLSLLAGLLDNCGIAPSADAQGLPGFAPLSESPSRSPPFMNWLR